MVADVQPDFYIRSFSIIYLISFGVFVWLLFQSRKIRCNPAMISFQILLILFVVWALDYSLFFLSPSLSTWLMLERIAYPCYSLTPVFVFTLSCQYTGYRDLFSRAWIPLIFVIPLITILLAYTSDFNSILMYDFFINESGLVAALDYQYGFWAYIHILSSAFFCVAALLILIGNLYTHPDIHRKGTYNIIAGVFTLLLWNLLYMVGLVPIWMYNLPFPLLLISIFFSVAIFRYHAFDFLPMARNIVLEQIDDLYLVLSPQNQIIDINPSMSQAFDVPVHRAIGSTISNAFAQWPGFVAFCSGRKSESDVYSHTSDLTTHLYSMKSTPIYDSDQHIIGRVLILHDITDVESAREELNHSYEELKTTNAALQGEIDNRVKIERALMLSKASLRTILDSIHDAVFIHDVTGKIIEVNAQMLRVYHLSDIDLAMRYSIRDDYSAPDSQVSRLVQIWEEAIDGKSTIFEWKARRPGDGSLFDAEIYITRVDLPAGPAILASVRDITERNQVQRSLFIANQKLNLLSSITRHDILNLVTGLQGYLGFALEEVPDGEAAEHLKKCTVIVAAIQRHIEFTRLYEDIGTRAPTWQNVETIIGIVRRDLFTGSLSYSMEIQDLEIFADPLLEKVFYTFVENTIRHGKNATEIRFSWGRDESGILLRYEDNGPGIPLAEKEHIFRRGFGQHTGFGLFIAKEILAITGLSIREIGEPGKGVRFEIQIPDGSWRVTGPGVGTV